MKTKQILLSLIVGTFSFSVIASETSKTPLSGKVLSDGSSTVFPISEAVGEEFQKANPEVKVAIAVSGTGGGFKKFCKAEIDITGASRPIEASELEACKTAKVEFVELPVAYDGLTVVVNKANTWAKSLTVAELKKIWEPESAVKKWSDVRKGFPDTKISLYGPGHDSGTFDYFTKAIVGKEKSSRADFTASEDDNSLVNGVVGDKNALGYFGFAYFDANKKKLNAVSIDNGKGAIAPSIESINKGTYAPLSRPLFIYVAAKSLTRPEVKAFAEFYIQTAPSLVAEVGYAALDSKLYPLIAKRLSSQVVGTLYSDLDSKKDLSLSSLLKADKSASAKTPASTVKSKKSAK